MVSQTALVSTSGNGIEIAVAASVDDDLVAAFSRLIPQLSRSAAVPPRDVSREIVEAQASPVLIARDLRDNGRIVGICLAEIATSGTAAICRQLPEREPLSDGVGRVASRVIAEPAAQDEAGSPGKYERDLAHRLSPLLVT